MVCCVAWMRSCIPNFMCWWCPTAGFCSKFRCWWLSFFFHWNSGDFLCSGCSVGWFYFFQKTTIRNSDYWVVAEQCCTEPRIVQFFSFLYHLTREGACGTRSWEGTKPQRQTWTGQRDIAHHMILCEKTTKVRGVGRWSSYSWGTGWALVGQQVIVLCTACFLSAYI